MIKLKKNLLIILLTIMFSFIYFKSYGYGELTSDNAKVFISKEYKVTFNYNKNWKPNLNYSNRYEGKDGFFMIDAIEGKDANLDTVAENEANHPLKIYGSNPEIIDLIVGGEKAKLIIPSKDQLPENNKQAEVIVKYPSPVNIGGTLYRYFVLYGSKNSIEEIYKTIKFIY